MIEALQIILCMCALLVAKTLLLYNRLLISCKNTVINCMDKTYLLLLLLLLLIFIIFAVNINNCFNQVFNENPGY